MPWPQVSGAEKKRIGVTSRTETRRYTNQSLPREWQRYGSTKPPYILVRHEETCYRGDTSMKLDAGTKKELRTLGYIQ